MALACFALGFLLASIKPISADVRIALGAGDFQSASRIDFDEVNVYPDKVQILHSGINYARVASNSMAPFITNESVVFEVPPSSTDIMVGDVISFRVPGIDGVVLHMVTQIVKKDEKVFYRTKGYANDFEDPWLVPEEDVQGVLVGVFR